MKLTTGILISILMAGNAMAQQAATPSFWDTLRAKIMGAPAPKPSAQHPASANPQAAKPAAASNAKPSPVQPKGAAPVTSASKTQAQPTQVQPTQVQPIKGQAANSASASVATKNKVPQNAQVQPAKAPATKAAVIPLVAAKPAELKTHEAATGDLKKEVLQKVAANSKAEETKASETKASETKAKNAESKPADAKAEVAVEDSKTAANTKSATKEFSYTGQRDPFISPVRTAAAGGSGCSTGKRCLAVDQINLKGVIKSDGGMIAVVTNSMDKAYFLRENDPVFNGYVVKITGDSVVFSETYEDKLGKPLTREVTKKLTTPAV